MADRALKLWTRGKQTQASEGWCVIWLLLSRRHQLLLAMGFNVVLIPYQRWLSARTLEEKQRLILSLLPPEISRPSVSHHSTPGAVPLGSLAEEGL